MEQITAIKLAEELFSIHTHAEIVFEQDPDQRVYREADIIALLHKLGYPKPDWDGYSNKCERELLSSPGDTIKETLEVRNITIAAFTKMLIGPLSFYADVWNLKAVTSLLKGEMIIDEHIAKDLERVLNIPKEFWMTREKLYRQKLEELK